MPAPQIILDLVQRFHDSRDLYRSGHYNEAQLRREFLDPFFTTLGWDMTNAQNNAPQYREVIQEDTVEIEGQVKAPDYAFGIFGVRKFFVEAKKPAVNIRYDIHPAFQLRRYAWSAHLPLSILTDFEEFAVYDTRVKPDHKDSASVARTMVFSYTEYAERWDEIASIFSKDAILKGSFDRYVQDNKAKKGTAEVDDDFLKSIETWREQLARNIALRNPSARSESTLNYAVQMTIDRLIFLRICEDRGIEPENQLRDLASSPLIYPRLVNLYIKADQKYNSGLFHFSAEKSQTSAEDTFTPNLAIDDKVLKEIITSLYYPASAYAFNVIPVEILGQVYEQFLGKVIRLTAGGQAKVEEKPEVRKAGGVYYTPRYIVDYIVENTVGKLLEGKTPKEAAELRIVDPACGSGSFLLGAYKCLLDWHHQYYLDPANGGADSFTRGRNPVLVQRSADEYYLTTAEKKRILLNNIYGVDLDHQAVEVTKLSLLLKLLEEETGQLSLGFERVLPDLGHNIRCGNSLIGWDYFGGQLLADDEEVKRVNPFNWQEAFPEVFTRGGFDAVIGNPPYIRIQFLADASLRQLTYYKHKYFAASKGNYDIYVLFIELAHTLVSHDGHAGFILPNKFLTTDYGGPIRDLLIDSESIERIVNFGAFQVFPNVSTYTCLLFISGIKNQHLLYGEAKTSELSLVRFSETKIPIKGSTWVFYSDEEESFFDQLFQNTITLKEIPCKINRGVSSGNDKVYIIKLIGGKYFTQQGESIEIEPEILRIPIYSTDFSRYSFIPNPTDRIIFPYEKVGERYSIISLEKLKLFYPQAFAYLSANKRELEKRKQYSAWYGFSAPRSLDSFDNADMLIPLLANEGSVALIDKPSNQFCLMASGGFAISVDNSKVNPRVILAVLNSTPIFNWLRKNSNVFRGGWITCTKQYVEKIPFPNSCLRQTYQGKNYEKLLAAVSLIMECKSTVARTVNDLDILTSKIKYIDQEIEGLVDSLYRVE